MQQRFADARRASAIRAVARANGKRKTGKVLGIFPRRAARDVDVHEFRPQVEDVWKAIRF
jgi:hypothetical protein